jgi:hypothetical protein
MYKDVPQGSETDLDGIYLLAHGISPDGSIGSDQIDAPTADPIRPRTPRARTPRRADQDRAA